jgi:hypothetical protein
LEERTGEVSLVGGRKRVLINGYRTNSESHCRERGTFERTMKSATTPLEVSINIIPLSRANFSHSSVDSAMITEMKLK